MLKVLKRWGPYRKIILLVYLLIIKQPINEKN